MATAKGAPSDAATTLKPAGSASTWSPWLIHTWWRLARLPQAVEQRAVAGDLDEGAAELAMVGRRDPAAELLRHGLLAVADAEDRQARVEEVLRRARAVVPRHRGGAAGEDDALRLQPLERLVGAVERRDLAIDAGLAHPPRDQLGHLAAEIDDEDGIAGLDRHGGRLGIASPPVQRRYRRRREAAILCGGRWRLTHGHAGTE